MAGDAKSKPSFSRLRKWGIGLNLIVRTAVVLAVVVMANYLSGLCFSRLYFSSQTRIELSPRTVSLLKSLTNDVKVTLYYDRQDPVFTTIAGLLNEYRTVNHHITVQTVDYVRDAGQAEKIKSEYKSWFSADNDKNLVIFRCEDRVKVVPGDELMRYTLEALPGTVEGKLQFDKKPVEFNGEMAFTAMLIAVTSPKPMKAYFLQGHREPRFDSTNQDGYLAFATLLKQDYVQLEPLSLLGTNGVPPDCNLLIVAGPETPLDDGELEQVDQYLTQGGRLFALLGYKSVQQPTGLERVLKTWGVEVGTNIVQEPKNTTGGHDVVVEDFSPHPVVNPLIGSRLRLVLPRPVRKTEVSSRSVDVPKVEEIAFSSREAFLADDPAKGHARFPLIATVEKGLVPGVVTEHGTTRIVVVGDSLCLGNICIDADENRYFAGYVANWLLDRLALTQGVPPRPITEFRLAFTRGERQVVQWLLLAAMPGAVLLFGGLVWLRRRK